MFRRNVDEPELARLFQDVRANAGHGFSRTAFRLVSYLIKLLISEGRKIFRLLKIISRLKFHVEDDFEVCFTCRKRN